MTSSSARGDLRRPAPAGATVAAIDRILAANGVRVDLESAVYRADHGIRPAQNVALARKARADRPSIYGDDALGWALARAGRCRGGSGLVAAVAQARNPGRAALVPSRLCGRVRRRQGRDEGRGTRRRSRSIRTSRCGSHRWRGRPSREALGGPPRGRRRGRRGARSHRASHRRIRSATSPSTTSQTSIWRATGSIVRYALDLAEIPTFQEGADGASAGYAAALAREARADGRRHAGSARRRVASDVGAAGRRRPRRRCASMRSFVRRRRARS